MFNLSKRMGEMSVWFFLGVFTILTCSVTTNPLSLSVNEDAFKSIKLTDLNDDCLYDTFAYLHLDDLNNLPKASSRFTLVAGYAFTKSVLASVEEIKYRLTSGNHDTWALSRKLDWMLTPGNGPKSDPYLYQKVVLLLKKLAVEESDLQYSHESPSFTPALDLFAKSTINATNNFGDVASILSVFDHYEILKFFGKFWRFDSATLLSYIYMLILEKSGEHLNRQFTYSMMLQTNKIRNAANAYYLLSTIGDDEDVEYVERFKLNWNLYKGDVPSNAAKGKFHLVIAKEEVQRLQGIDFYSSSEMLERKQTFTRTYCAMRSLIAFNSTQLIDSSNLNLAIFDLAEETSRHKYYETMTKFKIPFVRTSPAEALLQKVDSIRESAINAFADQMGAEPSSIDSASPFLNMAAYQQAQIDRKIIASLRRSLVVECKGSQVAETGFQQLKLNLDKLTGKSSAADVVEALTNKKNTETSYEKKLMHTIQSKIDELKAANDFADYIQLLRTVVGMGYTRKDWSGYHIEFSSLFEQTMLKLYFAFIKFVDRPHVFDQTEQLIEVDRVHSLLAEQFPENFINFIGVDMKKDCGALLSTIIANFNSTLTPKANESIKIRNKQRIVLKFLIILARSGYGRSVLFSPDMDFPIPVSRVIIESFYSLARFGGEFMAEDIGLLREWNEFDGRLDPEIKPIYELTASKFMNRTFEPSGNPNKDAFILWTHLTFAEHFFESDNRISDEMIENILTLEESINEAEITNEYLLSEILSQKLLFYSYHIDRVREKQEKTDLKRFVETKLDLLFYDSRDWRVATHGVGVLKSIFVAVENNREHAKQLLGADLIDRLGTVAYDLAQHRQSGVTFRSKYETCKEILNFKK